MTAFTDGVPTTVTNYQVSIWLKRKKADVTSIETLLQQIKSNSPVCKKIVRPKIIKKDAKRELEVSIMDPHFGLHILSESNNSWSFDKCETMIMTMLDEIIVQAKKFGKYERVIFPFGNDFLHVDNLQGTTTRGTNQPEAASFHEMFIRGQNLAINMVEKLKTVAPVKILVIPGNHDKQTAFSMGRLLGAYYHNDNNVEIDDSPTPYKFHRFGVNLLGFEHGHAVKPAIRLAALMANEAKDDWADTVYREWHLGDQHRKASAKPSTFAEQGVSIEYLPGLTPPNEWSNSHGYNWQKRAVMAFVWDYTAGPLARLQVNIDSYTGEIMK